MQSIQPSHSSRFGDAGMVALPAMGQNAQSPERYQTMLGAVLVSKGCHDGFTMGWPMMAAAATEALCQKLGDKQRHCEREWIV